MAELAPVFKFREFDSSGDPLVGGKLYSYIANTDIPLSTFTDDTEDTANANPTILDADGRASVWLSSGNYKFILKDADDVVIWTKNNVSLASSGTAGASLLTGTAVPDNVNGNNGDTYIRTTTGTVYTKSAGAWSATGSVGVGLIATGPFSFTQGQSATNLLAETVDSAAYTSADYFFEVIRGTTIFASGRLSLQYLNSSWRIVLGSALGDDHGLTFTLSGTTVAQLKLAATAGDDGTLKLKKILYAV